MESRIAKLAKGLSSNVGMVDAYIKSSGLPHPSFDIDAPLAWNIDSPEVERARISAIEATIELQDLLMGPMMLLRPNYNATSLQVIYRFDVATKVPIHGEISYADLAQLCDVYEPDLKRILRFAMCYHRTFQEPRKGFVAHTAASRSIAERPEIKETIGVMFDETWQSYARTTEALRRFKSQEMNETGFSLAHGTDFSYFAYLNANPEKSSRFALAMQAFGDGPDISPDFLVNHFPWSSLGHATVVDLGGSNGFVSISIAESHPNLSFIVQDRPHVIGKAKSVEMPPSLTERINFMEHDFFTQQPIIADIYLFRYIFHNWPDSYAISILRQLVPVMRRGVRVLINDHLLPEPNTSSLTTEREIRSMDMLMMTLCNGRERDKEDWIFLLSAADRRFRFVSAFVPEGSSLAIIEAVWDE